MVIKGLEKWGDSIVEGKLGNGNTLYYVEEEGTSFPVGIYLKEGKMEVYNQVDEKLMRILNNSRKYGFRVRIWYGDGKTGEAWNEEYDVVGRVGRSNGNIKIPILLSNKRSYGGVALLVGSIIRVDDIEEKRTLWKVSNFHVGKMIIEEHKEEDYPFRVFMTEDSGVISNVANFKTQLQAVHWIDFMNGKRYCK